MHVKVGNCLSDRREVTGGAVQGSVLGVMDHNAVIEGVDQNLLTECHKYVDDLTTTETIGPEADGYLAVVGGEEKPMFHAPDSEENLQSVMDYCEEKGLKVNEKKTQLLAVSPRGGTAVWLQAGRECVESSEKMKLLGFIFSDKPTVAPQIENLITRATKRMFCLLYTSPSPRDS